MRPWLPAGKLEGPNNLAQALMGRRIMLGRWGVVKLIGLKDQLMGFPVSSVGTF
jgi:hypothetical protein